VELGWLEYPVRELAKANATSFSFEYFTPSGHRHFRCPVLPGT
jgi:hypothetical protein